VPGEKKIHWEI